MTKTKRKMIEDSIACDTDRLFADLPTAISYMTEIARLHGDKHGLHLEEHWTGYEDTEMRFAFLRPETVHEAIERRSHEAKQKQAKAARTRQVEMERECEEAKTSPERILWLENRKKAALLRMEMGQALSSAT